MQQKAVLEGLGVTNDDQEKIFAGNFQRLFA